MDSKADVNKADAQRFTPLFWAVDRRNMETAPNFPWMVTADPMPLIRKLLDAGANPNAIVNNTPRARMREGSPRIVFATALMRAAFAADLELVKLLLDHGADPKIISKDGETMLSAAAGLAFIHGYHRGKSPEERLQVVKLFVELGNDVNQADDYGITPLMAAANIGDIPMIQYLIDKGADLAAHDLGKKNDGQFGSSVEPLMPIDYAIGVGTFVPNNAVIIHEEAVALMARLMKERGITHTTSECTLRGFTCAQARVDPKVASPAEIMRARKLAIGHQIEGVTGGLEAKVGPWSLERGKTCGPMGRWCGVRRCGARGRGREGSRSCRTLTRSVTPGPDPRPLGLDLRTPAPSRHRTVHENASRNRRCRSGRAAAWTPAASQRHRFGHRRESQPRLEAGPTVLEGETCGPMGRWCGVRRCGARGRGHEGSRSRRSLTLYCHTLGLDPRTLGLDPRTLGLDPRTPAPSPPRTVHETQSESSVQVRQGCCLDTCCISTASTRSSSRIAAAST